MVVVLYHLRESFSSVWALSWVPVHGELAVDLFFVLSGFILCHVYEKVPFINFHSVARFYVTRLARVYPLHLVTLFATLIAILACPGMADSFRADFFSRKAFILNLFLIQNWGFIDVSWNVVAWSISAEWFMYLLFPLLKTFTQFKNSDSSRYLICLTFLFAIHLSLIEYRGMPGYGGMCLGGMIRVAFELTYGMLAYQLRASYARCRFKSQAFAICSAVAFQALWEQSMWFLFVPASIVILLHLSLPEGRTFQLMSHSWLVWLGEISYSLYMWHWIAIQLTKRQLNFLSATHLTATLLVGALLVLIIAISAASNVIIEQPTRRLARRFVRFNP